MQILTCFCLPGPIPAENKPNLAFSPLVRTSIGSFQILGHSSWLWNVSTKGADFCFPYVPVTAKETSVHVFVRRKKRQHSWYSKPMLKIILFLDFTLCKDVNLPTYGDAFWRSYYISWKGQIDWSQMWELLQEEGEYLIDFFGKNCVLRWDERVNAGTSVPSIT